MKLPSPFEKATGRVCHHGVFGPGVSARSVRPSWLKSPVSTLAPVAWAHPAKSGCAAFVTVKLPSPFDRATGILVHPEPPTSAMSVRPS